MARPLRREPDEITGEAAVAAPDPGALFDGVPLPSRMRPGPPLDPAADWAAFVGLVRPLLAQAQESGALQAARLAATFAQEPVPPDASEAIAWCTDLLAACPALDQRNPKDWKRAADPVASGVFVPFARWLVARSGASILVACLEVLAPRPLNDRGFMPWSLWQIPNVRGVRSALVATPDADYEAAVAACCRRAAEADNRDIAAYLAYVLGDDRPEADHELRAIVQLPLYGDAYKQWRIAPFVVGLPPSQASAFLTRPARSGISVDRATIAEAAATAIAAAAQAGESPMPTLAWLLRETQGADTTNIAKAIIATRADDALPTLLPVLRIKLVRDALDAADIWDPAFMLRAYLAAAEGKAAAAWAPRVTALVTRHGADAARAWAKAGSQTIAGRLDRLIAVREVPLAPREEWPAVLRDPPWRRKARAPERPVLALAPIPTPISYDPRGLDPRDSVPMGHVLSDLTELPAFIAEAEAAHPNSGEEPRIAEPVPDAENIEAILGWLGRRLYIAVDPRRLAYAELFESVARQPEPLALLLWDADHLLVMLRVMRWRTVIPQMMDRFGAAAMPGFAKLFATDPSQFMPLVAHIDAGDVAPTVARVLVKANRLRDDVAAWLRDHPRTAAMRLLPDSLGAAGPAREAADAALHLIGATPEGRAEIDAAIAAYAALEPNVRDAVAAGVDADPLEQAPRKPPKLPGWIVPSALARPRLVSGDALPDEAVVALCEMLAFSSPLAPYAGVARVRAACTRESLDAFALDLFRAWLGAGGKAALDWAMRAMVQVGGAACARDLTRQVRVWAGERAKPKALAGLDVLAAMGSDAALMHLSATAEKSPYAILRERATKLVDALAEARGLSLDELADQLTPDLGLDARGGLDLTFGPRSFRVGFDEMLIPWVRDAADQRLATLPRPLKSDDAALAKDAARRWAGLKRDAEAVGGQHISRLEMMMASQRRIEPALFQTAFAGHPLMRHVAGRLVWGLYEGAGPDGRLLQSFRITEDMSFADAGDAPVALDLDGGRLIGPAHPLHLAPDELARWSALFGDYEIAQPFPQLARETFALDKGEAENARIMRFDGKRVAGGRLRWLRQDWVARGDPVTAVQRTIRLPDGTSLVALLAFEDGFKHHPASGDVVQTLRTLTLQDERRNGPSATHRFGDLDAVTASEILRAPSLLVAAGID